MIIQQDAPSPITRIPHKVTNKTYEMQGWNAKMAGYREDQCPYYPTSTAEKHWRKGYRS